MKHAFVVGGVIVACASSGCGGGPSPAADFGDGVSVEPLLLDPGTVPEAPRDDTPAEPRDRTATVSGIAVDDDGRPVADAGVTVNGVATRTDRGGAWSATVVDATRIIATFEEAGYAPVTHVGDRSQSGIKVQMPAVERVAVDAPLRGFTVRESRHGSSVTVPPNALVSARGARPTGRVWVELHTYDVGRIGAPQPPGDGAAIDGRGQDATVESIAALSIAVHDDDGVAYDLVRGVQASAQIGVAEEMRGVAAENTRAGTSSYDDGSGAWRSGGTVALYDARKLAYLATIESLDEVWDVDLVPYATAPACLGVRIERETTVVPVVVALYRFRYNYEDWKFVRFLDFDDYDKHAIYRMGENQSYKFEVYSGDAETLLSSWTVQTGAGQSAPYPPVSQCQSAELATTHPPWPQFLSLPDAGSSASAAAYYARIDPASLRASLSAFKAVNGFSTQNPGVNAEFFNKNELGLGRDLTCAANGNGNFACYLRKYGHPGETPKKALHDMFANVDPGDTVAMEFSGVPGRGIGNVVKFYVFAPSGVRKLSTAFDPQGEKFVPNVCTGCHGGTPSETYPDPASADIGAVFVPVDPSTHVYSPVRPRTVQEDALRQINAWVHTQTRPEAASVKDYVESMYPDGVDAPGSVAAAFVPRSYALAFRQSTYTSIIKPYCQLCHLARPVFDWTDYGNLQAHAPAVHDYTCPTPGSGPTVMPHAFVPFRNLWQGPLGRQRVDKLMADIGAPLCPEEPHSVLPPCDPNVCNGMWTYCVAEDCTYCNYYCSDGYCIDPCY